MDKNADKFVKRTENQTAAPHNQSPCQRPLQPKYNKIQSWHMKHSASEVPNKQKPQAYLSKSKVNHEKLFILGKKQKISQEYCVGVIAELLNNKKDHVTSLTH